MGTHGPAYATASSRASTRISRGIGIRSQKRTAINKVKKMTLKEQFRNWLFEEKESADDYSNHAHAISVDESKLHSEGMRLQIYSASGGFVIETRKYDRRKDENITSMYVITEEMDLGNEIGKILTMESLK
jgi:hypothetical protein